ncbi:MAG: hypothetical protein H7269_01205 [Cellulomonas sp.]|nr:hypothetical protein [Cellulomonas sp.]
MTYPRWATERSDQTAAGESLEPADAPLARLRNRRLLGALRRRGVLILALVVVAVILVLIAANLVATPDLAAPGAPAIVAAAPGLAATVPAAADPGAAGSAAEVGAVPLLRL